MSWDLFESIVLHIRTDDGDVVVKAGGAANHHIDREIAAHPGYTDSLSDTGVAAKLIDSDSVLRIMLLEYLPGVLVEGTEAEYLPETYARAGALLRRLHSSASRQDADHERRATARALSWLDGPHRIDSRLASAARRALEAAPDACVTVVPTHGDWQPRNWLIDDGTIRVIDFGRFAFRTPSTDLTRLAGQQWRGRPELESAFFDAYGPDPRESEPERWLLDRIREAVGTACWAFQVGDESFEAHGHRMLTELLTSQ